MIHAVCNKCWERVWSIECFMKLSNCGKNAMFLRVIYFVKAMIKVF